MTTETIAAARSETLSPGRRLVLLSGPLRCIVLARPGSQAIDMPWAASGGEHPVDGVDEFVAPERLRDGLIGAEMRRRAEEVARPQAAAPRHREDADLAIDPAQMLQHLDAVHLRHEKIGDDQVGARRRAQALQRAATVGGLDHQMPGALEQR